MVPIYVITMMLPDGVELHQRFKSVDHLHRYYNCSLIDVKAHSRFDGEIERYLNLPLEDCDDPIASWKENKNSFFLLRNLAAEILSIPASSSSSERAFSVGTRVNLI